MPNLGDLATARVAGLGQGETSIKCKDIFLSQKGACGFRSSVDFVIHLASSSHNLMCFPEQSSLFANNRASREDCVGTVVTLLVDHAKSLKSVVTDWGFHPGTPLTGDACDNAGPNNRMNSKANENDCATVKAPRKVYMREWICLVSILIVR